MLPAIRKTGAYAIPKFRSDQTRKALPNGLTIEQQDAIKQLVKARTETVPANKRAGAAIRLWSSIKSKFKVSYKEVPPEHFIEALSLVARVPLEGEVLEAEQKSVPKFTPPVWKRPDKTDRTIEHTKQLVSDLRLWGRNQPWGREVQVPFDQALVDLRDLLVTCWTEVDEALISISHGVRYLHRWQGRNGRMGNVG